MTTVELYPVTQAVYDHLSDVLDVPVHIGERPKGEKPAVIVHEVDGGGGYWRGIDGDHRDGTFAWQVTFVGAAQPQASWHRDRIVAAMTDGALDVARVKHVDGTGAPRIHRDSDVDVWVSTPTFHITVV